MLGSIFTKTLYERRLSTAIWTIVLAIYTISIIALYPTLKQAFGEALENIPESMQSIMGNANDYQNINGYIDIQIIAQMIFLTLILGIIIGVNLIAGEEKSGTLHTLLAQPVSRAKIYTQKILAIAVITGVASFIGIGLGSVVGAMMVGEFSNLYVDKVFMGAGMTWLLTLCFSTLAYMIGAITGNRAAGGVVAGMYAFGSYVITALAASAKSLEPLNTFSLFHYFNQPSIMKNGLDFGNIAVLLLVTLVFFVIGLVVFRHRNIY